MSYDLVRLALLTMPPPLALDDPQGPYEHEMRNERISKPPPPLQLLPPLSAEEERYVRAVQGWLMAVRWWAAKHPTSPEDAKIGVTCPTFEHWKRLFRPWLEALTTESTFLPAGHGFPAWQLLCDYMHTVGKGEDPAGFGTLTLEEHEALEQQSIDRAMAENESRSPERF